MSKKNKTEFKENSFVDIPLDLLVPADWNYKTDDEYRQEKLKNNIKRNGQVENIIVRLLSTGFYEIVNGNHRYQALKELGNFPNVHCYNMGVISDSKAKRIAIETNETRFDTDNIKLAQTIKDLQEEFSFEELENTMPYTLDELNNFDNLLSFSSFNNELNKENIIENNQDLNEESKAGNLIKKFIIPPFSVLDTRQGYWQDRKKQWLSLGIKSELGRDNVQSSLGSAFKLKVIASSNQKLSKDNIEVPNWAVTSIFDPVICELMFKWFNIENGSILDPFSGGSVRGVVASFLGYDYYGIDLRKEQIYENIKQFEELKNNFINSQALNIPFIYTPKWEIGNSVNLDSIYSNKMFDFIFSCPPYFDLEVYSDNPEDLSTMDWEKFSTEYTLIINKAVKQLKEDRFACFVVGDVRDKKGFYYNFIDLTKKAFIESGALFYNELILVNVAGTLPVRVGKSFGGYRKVGKMHQNILVFYKGNPKNIPKNFNEIVLNQLNLEENNEID